MALISLPIGWEDYAFMLSNTINNPDDHSHNSPDGRKKSFITLPTYLATIALMTLISLLIYAGKIMVSCLQTPLITLILPMGTNDN